MISGRPRMLLGDYHLTFVSGATLGFVAVVLALRISEPRRTHVVAIEPLPA